MSEPDHCGVGGVVTVTVWRGGAVTDHLVHPNTVTNAGLNLLLDQTFSAVPAGTTWHLGLRGNGEQTPEDTYATKAWEEFTGYAGDRKPWTHAAASEGRIVSSSRASFAVQGGESIVRGAFLTDAATKGSAGRLFMVASFGRALILYPGDTVDVEYDLRLGRA